MSGIKRNISVDTWTTVINARVILRQIWTKNPSVRLLRYFQLKINIIYFPDVSSLLLYLDSTNGSLRILRRHSKSKNRAEILNGMIFHCFKWHIVFNYDFVVFVPD